MTTVAEHYENHLAPVYLWMAGGFDAAISRGDGRFIPVRSDNDRILTCFLEYSQDYVTVHDVLHERNAATWHQRVSSYRKLRLSPGWVSATLQDMGFTVRIEPGLAGMIRVVADKRSMHAA